MKSNATTVAEYLKELPVDRRNVIMAVRKTIRKHLPLGYKEIMQYGMISYVVPLKLYPAGYLGDSTVPLPYISLASQKNHMAIYLMGLYADDKLYRWFEEAYRKSGKRFDMGKCCVRFKTIENLPLEVIGKAVSKIAPTKMIQYYETARIQRGKKK